ncbi:MAG: N4-gp56 family major capsid protein [Thermoplasmatales archaeon]|nr:N4-gp56 family major capsid protein [Thermoplasmatales archaeon]
MKSIIELVQGGGTDWDAISDRKELAEWAKDIIKRAAANTKAEAVLGEAGRVYTIQGNYFRVPIIKKMTEPSTWAYTPGTALESENFDISAVNLPLSRYGFMTEITEDALKDWAFINMPIGDFIKDEMATWLAEKKDKLILQAFANSTIASLTVPYVLAGSDNTVDAGDILTPALFNEAITKIRENNRGVEGQLYAFLHPRQIKALRDDDQFTNASEYGSNEVVMTGEIGKYLGVKIIETTNVATYEGTTQSPVGSFNTTGYEGVLIDNKYSMAVATNDPLRIELNYEPSKLIHEVVASFTYAIGKIDNNGICLLISAKA